MHCSYSRMFVFEIKLLSMYIDKSCWRLQLWRVTWLEYDVRIRHVAESVVSTSSRHTCVLYVRATSSTAMLMSQNRAMTLIVHVSHGTCTDGFADDKKRNSLQNLFLSCGRVESLCLSISRGGEDVEQWPSRTGILIINLTWTSSHQFCVLLFSL